MRPHRTDGVSLGFGTIFLLVALWWAVSQMVNLALPMLGWLLAGVLIMFGVVGLLGAIRSGRRPEVREPVAAEAVVRTPGDLPPQMHAEIVRELLDDPAERFTREHPAGPQQSSTGQPSTGQSGAEHSSTEPDVPGQPKRD